MKTKYLSYGVIEASLADYVQQNITISNLDLKFIRDFAYFNNMDGDYDEIQIKTNDTELCSLVHKVLIDYAQHLKDNGFVIIKRDDLGYRIN